MEGWRERNPDPKGGRSKCTVSDYQEGAGERIFFDGQRGGLMQSQRFVFPRCPASLNVFIFFGFYVEYSGRNNDLMKYPYPGQKMSGKFLHQLNSHGRELQL